MLRKQPVPDRTLLRQVTQRLQRAGLGYGCSVTATVSKGQVTLSGGIEREAQRRSALRAASGASGVGRVIDQMTVKAKTKTYGDHH